MSIRRFFRREQWDRDRAEEIESYVQIETDDNVARGMPYDEAREAALRKFGNRTLVREEIYRMNTMTFVETLVGDVRYSLRTLARSPMFAAATVLTLAIGIGANTAVFSVVNSVLLRPLHYPSPEQLVALHQDAPGAAGLANSTDGLPLSSSMYFTYSDHNRTFQSLGVWIQETANVTGIGQPEQVRTISVTDGVLEALSVPPAVGRWLLPSDQVSPPGAAPGAVTEHSTAVMLSYGYWQRRFGGNPSAIGQRLTVDSEPREIVGVMPQGFRIVNADTDLILPMGKAFDRNHQILAGFAFSGIGRLKPGISMEKANADLARLVPVWMDSWSNGPGSNSRWYENWRITPNIRPLKQQVVGNIGNVLWIVMGTIALVMLLACANVTNLLLVRAEARQQELAVRAALGAGVLRILRGLLVESVLLGLIGGVLGVGVAYAGLRLLAAIGPANLPRLNEISMDARTFAFTLALSILSGLLLGVVPALKYAGPKISATLRTASRTASSSRERHRARNLLVVGQVAIALVLLVSAGLMIRTAQALRTVDPGFTDAQHLQTVQISIPSSLISNPELVTRAQNAVEDKLAGIPGVVSVSFAGAVPMQHEVPGWNNIYAEGKEYPNGTAPLRRFERIAPGFLHTMGTQLKAGRDFTWTDTYDLRPVVLISENLAREFWGSPSAAIGKRLSVFSDQKWHEVIGVVQDVHQNGIQEDAPAIVYWTAQTLNPFAPNREVWPSRTATFVIRSDRAGTEGFLNQLQHAVWSVNASLPLASVRTMQEIYDESLATTSFTLVMLAIAGSMALMLGLIGVYGVISYTVSQRKREIGIRVALGAEPRSLRWLFVRYGLALAAAGTVIGMVAAVGLTRLMKTVLFGISPVDPVTYMAVPVVLIAATVLASYLPARRASTVNPIETLRAE